MKFPDDGEADCLLDLGFGTLQGTSLYGGFYYGTTLLLKVCFLHASPSWLSVRANGNDIGGP